MELPPLTECKDCLVVDLVGHYMHGFRRPGIMVGNYTYPVPPITTIYGLINACRDAPRDDYELLNRLYITLKHLNRPLVVGDYAILRKISQLRKANTGVPGAIKKYVLDAYGIDAELFAVMTKEKVNENLKNSNACDRCKMNGSRCTTPYKCDDAPCKELSSIPYWMSSPTRREQILKPVYRCYITGYPEDLQQIKNALEDPAVSPGLGRPDDLCSIKNISIKPSEYIESKYCCTLTSYPGKCDDIAFESTPMPVGFEKSEDDFKTIYKICYIPPYNSVIEFTGTVRPCLKIDDDIISPVSALIR